MSLMRAPKIKVCRPGGLDGMTKRFDRSGWAFLVVVCLPSISGGRWLKGVCVGRCSIMKCMRQWCRAPFRRELDQWNGRQRV